MKKPWRERVELAIKRGRATRRDIQEAHDPQTCLVGEVAARVNEVIGKRVVGYMRANFSLSPDGRLVSPHLFRCAGREFPGLLEELSDFPERRRVTAARLRALVDAADDRALELKREEAP